jgi:predicted flap endonuclease-1-like 5' DNA nuclease
VIADNLIYENGGSAVNPICGIFVGAGEDVQVTSNRITANGALSADYETARLEGVRGGIFVRFATAFVAGGTADANQKPALRVEDNRIDQPAGRAITAYAFGPVSCVGNFLNSERAGRWNILDALIGAVLILNLGGIHRLLRFGQATNALDTAGAAATASSFRNQALAELVLPGGEVLFNSNQVRMGPLNRTFISQLVLTLDDTGYDGNQSAAFRSDLLFANALVLANTVRTTDNRWREDASACYFSLLSYAVTMNASVSPGMNTCAHNQGDHCIVPLAAAPIPVVDDGNLERNRTFCQRIEAEPGTLSRYLVQGLVAVWASQNAGTISAQQAPVLAQKATVQSLDSVKTMQASYQQAYLGESQRLAGKYGADSPRVMATAQRAQKNAVILQQLQVEGELAAIPQQQQPDSGAVLDGRVVDAAYRGRSDLKVELVRKDGTAVGVTGTTDATGYYAVSMDQQTAQALAKEKELYVQVSDAKGTVLQRADTPLQVKPGAAVRSEVTVAVRTAPQSVIAGATVIYRGSAAGGKSTPLENIKGIGPVTAAKLRAAGIPDVEALLRTPGEKLVEIAGFDAEVLRKEAASALHEGVVPPKEGTPPKDAQADRPPRGRQRGTKKPPKK